MKQVDELFTWYQSLTLESLERIDQFYDDNTYFKDPFNEIHGVQNVKKIFLDMFSELKNPHFVFVDTITENKQVFVTWDFIFQFKDKKYTIHGSSHLKLNDENKIFYHRDYWDVGEELFLKIPIIKNVYGVIRKKIASHGN